MCRVGVRGKCDLPHGMAVSTVADMKLRHFAIVFVTALAGCATKAPQEPVRKPGFLERTWTSTQKGSKRIWKSTKTGTSEGWQSAKELVASPFTKKKPANPAASFRQLEAAILIKPDAVRLSTTHSIEATVLITNKAARGMQLSFSTSQHIEVVVKTEDGKVIHRWSEDQRIERESSFVAVNPGERLEYVVNISTRNMAAGKTYTIEATVPGYEAIFARKVVVPQS